MNKKHIALFSAAMMFSTSVFCQNWYIDGGAGFVNFDDGVDEISPTNLYLRGGYRFNPYFSIGLESSVTVSPDQLPSVPDVDLSVSAVTFFLRGGVPVGESVLIYGQIGRTNTELTAEYQGLEISEDDNDTSLGFGAEIDIGNSPAYVALNYTLYNNNDGVDVTGLNIGVGARF